MTARQRRSVALGAGVVAILLAGISHVFACGSLATLNLSSGTGPAGSRVTATGASYRTSGGDPVVLRWNSVDGPELARTTPNARGEITVAFTVPQAIPGYYIVVAVQRDAAGVDAYGTPSRASFQIVVGNAPPPATTATTVAPPTTRRPAPTTTSTVPLPTSTSAVPATTVAVPTTSPEASVAARPVAARGDQSDDGPPAVLVAVATALLLAVVVGLSRRRHTAQPRAVR